MDVAGEKRKRAALIDLSQTSDQRPQDLKPPPREKGGLEREKGKAREEDKEAIRLQAEQSAHAQKQLDELIAKKAAASGMHSEEEDNLPQISVVAAPTIQKSEEMGPTTDVPLWIEVGKQASIQVMKKKKKKKKTPNESERMKRRRRKEENELRILAEKPCKSKSRKKLSSSGVIPEPSGSLPSQEGEEKKKKKKKKNMVMKKSGKKNEKGKGKGKELDDGYAPDNDPSGAQRSKKRPRKDPNRNNEKWLRYKGLFSKYYADIGNLKIPRAYVVEGVKLGVILSTMRLEGNFVKDNPQRKQWLLERGVSFTYDSDKSSTEEKWDRYKKIFSKYYADNGNLKIPRTCNIDGVNIGQVLIKIRCYGSFVKGYPQRKQWLLEKGVSFTYDSEKSRWREQ